MKTRDKITKNYVLITPESWVETKIHGWNSLCSNTLHISPQIGANFLQYTVISPENQGNIRLWDGFLTGIQRFCYIEKGEVELSLDGWGEPLDEFRFINYKEKTKRQTLTSGDYFYIPKNFNHKITSIDGAKITVFEKKCTLNISILQKPIICNSNDISGSSFMGDKNVSIKHLIGVDNIIDMQVNILTFKPESVLPMTEVHVMEHGMKILSGSGTYYLNQNPVKVQKGDVLWIGPYCPQYVENRELRPLDSFTGPGEKINPMETLSYIYYKNTENYRSEDLL